MQRSIRCLCVPLAFLWLAKNKMAQEVLTGQVVTSQSIGDRRLLMGQ